MHKTATIFSKWSPGGNTTIFFPPTHDLARLAKEALSHESLCAEQAGAIDCATKTLTMAGGEFCVNATRAFGACLSLEQERTQSEPAREQCHTVTVSGWPAPIRVQTQGYAPTWEVTAFLSHVVYTERTVDGLTLISLPGIHHILVPETQYPYPVGEERAWHARLRDRFGLTNAPCVGLLFWRNNAETYAIRPLVWVSATETLILENACGSGSLALALAQRPGIRVAITQPSGSLLTVTCKNACATIAGTVSLVAEGRVWLSR